MSLAVVYYSTKCNHCRELMEFVIAKNLKDNFTSVCIDDKKRNEIPMVIDRVPTIIHNNKVIVDEQLFGYVESMIRDNDVGAFDDLGRSGGKCMTNTSYSFVDDNEQSGMPTGGSSGFFLDLTKNDMDTSIYTPDETDSDDNKSQKMRNLNLEELITRRENDIKEINQN